MLTEILLRNYLFVSEARIPFGEGMTVITGETGAGKSILVGAISLIFADPVPVPEPADPKQPMYLEAVFDPTLNSELTAHLSELGQEAEENLILAREVSPAGKSTYYLNGRRVTASLMRELKPLMIDFHHQRDQQRLLAPAYQLEVLDTYAGAEDLRAEFADLLKKTRADLKRLEEMRAAESHNRELAELYQFQYEELEKASLRIGEDTELQHEYDLQSHAREIAESTAAISHDLFESDYSAHDRIRSAVASLGRFSGLDPRIDQARQSLADCLDILDGASGELAELVSGTEHDPSRLEKIQVRLDQINALVHKHRVKSIADLLELFDERRRQIEGFGNLSGTILALEASLTDEYLKLKKTAAKLSALRTLAARKLSTELAGAVKQLAISEPLFEISIDKKVDSEILMPEFLAQCTDTGTDSCAFLFSANPGAALKPLSMVASGGELSRILLAVKKVLADRIPSRLVILDEIDAGIGGRTAEQVAEFIRGLAERHRVMCITHLAQIAAIANRHIALTKRGNDSGTAIAIKMLSAPERRVELARMLSGSDSEVSLRHADELIDKYNKARK